MILILETKTNLIKNPNTKTTYIVDSVEKSLLTQRQYDLTTNDDTIAWFRRFGGTETAEKSYTCCGYKITKLTSSSPGKDLKTVREFSFYDISNKENEVFNDIFKKYDNGLFFIKRFKKGKTLKELKTILNKKAA